MLKGQQQQECALGFGFESTAEEVTAGLDLTGQTWLITGVNSGLGHESARVLAMRGATIIGTARTEEKARTTLDDIGGSGHAVACELSDLASVRAAVATVQALPTLSGILANAGIMALPNLQQIDGLERQLFVNHVGHAALVTGLLDHLSPTARVVMVSSGAHFMARRGIELDNLSGEDDYDPWRMYGRSKLANLLFAKELARRFEGTRRTANAIHPGVIRTNLARHIPNAQTWFATLGAREKTMAQGAATQCYVSTHPHTAKLSGAYFSDCAQAKTHEDARDPEIAAALWRRTEELIAR